MNNIIGQNILSKKRLLSLVFLLIVSLGIMAAPNSNGSTTNWNTASGWTPSGVPNLLFWAGTQDVVVSHDKNSGSLTITNNNSIRVTSGATLTITGNLTLGNASSIQIDAGGTLIITGSLLASNSPSSVTIDGTLNVGGDYDVSTSGVTHDLNGTVTVGGFMRVIGNTDINVNGGAVDVTGNLILGNNGVMQGCSGYVTYAAHAIGSCGFSYLKCCGVNYGTGCGNTPPPATSFDFATCGVYVGCSAPSNASIGNPHTICSGGDPSTLTSGGTGGATTFEWEWSANGTTGWTTIAGANSATYDPPAGLTVNRWYRRRGGDCAPTQWSAYTNTVLVTVDALPTITSTTGDSRCGSGTLDLSAVASSGTIDWYTASSGGSLAGSGSPWTTGSLSSTTIYYAEAVSAASCTSSIRVPATATVNTQPDTSISTPPNVCIGTAEDLTDDVITAEAGTWSITSNPGGDFDAIITGGNTFDATLIYTTPGTYELTYTLSGGPFTGCAITASRTITVYDLPDTLISNPLNVCIGSTEDLSDDVINADAGTWSISGTPSGGNPAIISGGSTFDASAANTDTGTYTLRYTITSAPGNCTRFSEKLVTVYPIPDFSVNNIGPFCLDASSDTLTALFISSVPNCDTTYLVDQFVINSQHTDTEYVNLVVGEEYEMIVTGEMNIDAPRYSDGAFSYLNPFAGATSGSRWRMNGSSVTSGPMRPTPDVYNPAHEYTFYFTATQAFNYFHYYDPNHADNGGEWNFTIRRIACDENFDWQINDVTDVSNRFDPATYGVGTHEAKLVYTNAFGCTAMDSIDVVVDSLPVVNLGNDTAICADSSIVFDAGSGASWIWNNGDVTQTTTVNSAGTYDVVLTDGNNCVGRDTIVLSINSLPVVNLGNDTAICMDSTIMFDAAVGVSWLWNNGDLTQTTTVNTGGDYDVTVTDINGCVNYDTVNLSINALPVVDLGNDTAICIDSTITFDALVGVIWTWNTGDLTQTTTVNTAGDYDVVVTDGDGCVNYDTINLFINALPVVDLGNDTAICIDSTITFDALLGASWTWNTGDLTQTTTVNTAGDYDVVVTDGNGCVNYDTINLSINALPVVDLGNDTAICIDSTITFDALVGVSWVWNNGDLSQTTTVNTGGDYDVVVTDGNGCVNYDTINLSINALPVVDLGIDTAICIDSTITFDALVGVSWTWSTGDLTQTTTVNTADDYDVVVTDGNGCVNYDTINLSINALPVVDLGNDTAICIDSTITFDALVGVSWAWNTGDLTQTTTVNTAGDYDVVVTDGNGCVNYDTINLSINALPVVDLGNDTAICIDSTITFDPLVGVSWVWNNGDLSQTTTVNTGGDYDVAVTDGNGCVNYDTINLSIHALPVVDLGNDTAICLDSTVTFDALVGVSWVWNNGDLSQITTVNTGGDYDVIVTDINNCVNYDTINLMINQLPIVNLGIDTMICRESDYLLNANAPTGIIFEWNDASSGSTLNTTGQGQYNIVVTDINNCVNYDTIQIDTFNSPIPVINVQDTAICLGDSVTLEVDPIYTFYSWTNAASVTNAATVDGTNEYILRIIDGNGCVGSDSAYVLVNALPNVDLVDSTQFCEFKPLILSVEEEDAQYTWSTGGSGREEQVFGEGNYWIDVVDTNDCFNTDTIWVFEGDDIQVDLGNDTTICKGTSIILDASFINTEIWQSLDTAGTYTVSEEDTYEVLVIDDEGCFGRDTIVVSVSEIPTVNIVQGDSLSLCEPAGEIQLVSITDDEGMDILWSTDESSNEIEVDYIDQYIAYKTNEFGCEGSDTIEVFAYCRPVTLTMPNIFTPNGDGTNETFVPIEGTLETLEFLATHTERIEFSVFNRWGRLMYESQNVLPLWDGMNLDQGEMGAEGVYYWVLNYTDVAGNSYSENGYVQLVK